jgi:hypothetical protein
MDDDVNGLVPFPTFISPILVVVIDGGEYGSPLPCSTGVDVVGSFPPPNQEFL